MEPDSLNISQNNPNIYPVLGKKVVFKPKINVEFVQ